MQVRDLIQELQRLNPCSDVEVEIHITHSEYGRKWEEIDHAKDCEVQPGVMDTVKIVVYP